MSLRHALLALLSSEPMTGYDVAKKFDGSVGYTWQAPHSQIYPELRRMEAESLIEAEVLQRGARGSKRRYTLTDLGMEELKTWLRADPGSPPERDVPRLRAAYLDLVESDAARRFFRAHIAHNERLLVMWETMQASIEERVNPVLQSRLARRPPEEHEAVVRWKTFAYDGLIARAKAEIEWGRSGLALADELERDAVAVAGQGDRTEIATNP